MTIAHDLRLASYGNTYGTAKTADFMLYIFVHILLLVLLFLERRLYIVPIIKYIMEIVPGCRCVTGKYRVENNGRSHREFSFCCGLDPGDGSSRSAGIILFTAAQDPGATDSDARGVDSRCVVTETFKVGAGQNKEKKAHATISCDRWRP